MTLKEKIQQRIIEINQHLNTTKVGEKSKNEMDGFLHGLQWVLSEMEKEQEGWVSIDDRLPDDYIDLLLYDGWQRMRGIYKKESGFLIWEDRYNQASTQITHWMLLPEPPKQ